MPPEICPVLVGRDEELNYLLSLRSGVVLLVGEAGIGKSRLLREFAARAKESGAKVLWARPEAVGDPGPYSLLLDLLETLVADGGPGREEAAQLSLALGSPSEAGSPEPPARQIAARTRGLLAAVSERTILVVEDVHLADEPSQAVIAHLARSAVDDGALMALSLRAEEELSAGTARLLDVFARDRLATRLELGPLSREQVARMVEEMWGITPSKEELEALASLADGVPFFVEELASSSRFGATVPSSITAAVEGRLSRLSPRALAVLNAASLSAGPIDPVAIAAASEVSEDELPGLLVEGVRIGLLADRDGRLEFRHSLLKRAVASRLLTVERRALHGRLADALRDRFAGAEAERHANSLALHFLEAGRHEEGADALLVAGRHALAVGAVGDAEEAFERAQQASPRCEPTARRGLAEVHIRRQQLDEAVSQLRRAEAALRAGDRSHELGETLSSLADVLRQQGKPEALAAAEESMRLVADPGACAQALRVLGLARVVFRSPEEGRSTLQESLRLSEEASDARLIIEACLDLAHHDATTRSLDSARGYAERATSLARDHGFNQLLGRAYSEEAQLLYARGKYESALAKLVEARDNLVRGLGSHHVSALDAQRAIVLWRLGRPAEADRIAARLEVGVQARGFGRVIRVWAAAERGEFGWAERFLDAWWDEAGPEYRDSSIEELRGAPDSPAGGGYAVFADAVLAATKPEPDAQDERRALLYWEFCRDWDYADVRAHAGAMASLVLARRGDRTQAAAITSQISPDESGPLLGALIEEALSESPPPADREDARGRMVHVVEQLRALGNESDLARNLIRLASISDPQAAKTHLKEALDLAKSSGSLLQAHRAESALRQLGFRPRAGRPKGSGRKEGVSAREEEVITLLASGATNAEIAKRLFLSDRTVQDHITRAGKRLGISGRAGLAAWAAKQGLI